MTNSLLILGGTGHIGLGTAVALGHEFEITAVGRQSFDNLPRPMQADMENARVRYTQLNLSDPTNSRKLQDMLSAHRLTLNTTEGYPDNPEDVSHHVTAAQKLMTLAVEAGYTQDSNRKFVRIGSPPVEIPNKAKYGIFPDNSLPSVRMITRHPAFRNPYFRTKILTRLVAEQLRAERGLALITAAPTAVLGRYGNHGADEPLPGYFHGRIKPALMPAIPVDMIPVTTLAQGLKLVFEQGRVGETYQLSGVHTDWADMMIKALTFAGKPDAVMRVPVSTLLLSACLIGDVFAMHALDKLARAFGGSLPLIFRPMTPALNLMMGHRSSDKAQHELGYRLPTQEEYEQAIKDYVIWHQELGTIA